ncbi:MFS transporter [Pseudolysinimonas kribbensis]|uniref:MFS transporter n=1 Tax=Pseudolysinimonas kribbensis TaxID=433641 RepID=A0ABQ6K0A1_9MICO|nr:MFS transporter [Pseudolysinimonas kribbensis]GMA93908.1 MFS transporter [Pseudolysinimonas kribbensis]
MSTVPGVDPATVTAPIPVQSGPRSFRDTFSALRERNYRLYLIGQFFANTGGWMNRIAMDWLVLQLTHNVGLVGLTVTIQFAPALLLGPWAGVLADRLPRRHVLKVTMGVSVVVNGTLAALVLTDAVQVWEVYLGALIVGIAMTIDGPSRSAFVSELVGTHRLPQAISMNASIFHLGGFLGPAISGVLIAAVGSGWSIAICAVTATVPIAALFRMRTRDLTIATPRPRERGQIREAVRYIRSKPTIVWPMVLVVFVATFGMNLPVLFTASADHVWHTGSAGYGLYTSLAAVGALSGALLSARRKSLRLRTIIPLIVLYGVVTASAGSAPWYVLFLPLLVGIGICRILFMTAGESLTQLSTNLSIRGRVMSFWIMIGTGGQAIGGTLMGWIAELLGAQVAFAVAGLVPAAAGIVVAIILARRHQLSIRVNVRNPRRLVRIVSRGQVIVEH